jgi:hypothetical protein
MISEAMKYRIHATRVLVLVLALFCAVLPVCGQKKKGPQLEKPLAGPRATALRVTWLYVTADTASQKVARVQIGREMVVAETSGPWMRVYANTDMEEMHEDKDAPIVGDDTNGAPPPISGWLQGKGIVEETTPRRRPDTDGRGGWRGGGRLRPARAGERGAERAPVVSAASGDVPQLAAGV